MGFTKFKLLTERLLSGLGRSKTFFPFYDSQNDADYRVSLDTLITFISNELGVSSKAVFELTDVSNTGNDYISTLSITSYKTEALWIFKPSDDSDDVSTLNVDTKGALQIKEFNGTSLVDKTDLKSVNTYLLLNKTSYWLVVGAQVPDLSGYIPLTGTPSLTGDITASVGAERTFGYNTLLIKARWVFSYLGGFAESWLQSKVNDYEASVKTIGFDGLAQVQISVGNGTISKTLVFASEETCKLQGDILRLDDIDRNSAIASQPKALITKEFADANYLGGSTNLGYTPSATNGVVTSDTGTDATIPLADGTNAGLSLNDYTSAEKSKLSGIAAGAEVNVNADWNAVIGDAQILNKPTIVSDAEMQSGIENTKYTTALRIATWWTWIKTQVQTFAAQITFSVALRINTSNAANAILGVNGNGVLAFTDNSSAVNRVEIVNAIAAGTLIIRANGSDTNIPIRIDSKGASSVILRTNTNDRFEVTSTGIVKLLAYTGSVDKVATISTDGSVSNSYGLINEVLHQQYTDATAIVLATKTSVFKTDYGAKTIPTLQMNVLGATFLYKGWAWFSVPASTGGNITIDLDLAFNNLTTNTYDLSTNYGSVVTNNLVKIEIDFTTEATGASGKLRGVLTIRDVDKGATLIEKSFVSTQDLTTDKILDLSITFGTASVNSWTTKSGLMRQIA